MRISKTIIPISIVVSVVLTGCSENNTVFNEPEGIRAYETDAQIMARFVEVDRTTGTFVLNPDKKVTASDYLLNSGREELMTVSKINRNRFINEMKAVNRQLSAVKRSGAVSAFVYSTQTSNVVIDGDDNDSFYISKLNEDYYSHGRVASLSLEEGKSRSVSFFAQSDMVMTVNIGNCSTFYCAQVSLGNQSNSDSKIVFISGVKSFIPTHNYRLVAPSILDNNKTLRGQAEIPVHLLKLKILNVKV